MDAIVQTLLDELPAIFDGSDLDRLTGNAIRWGTIQNQRSRGEAPAECFVRRGKRVIVHRDPFIRWWASTLQPAKRPPLNIEPKRRGRLQKARVATVA